jgi:uncharacterized membrane protein
MEDARRQVARWVLALFFLLGGSAHFYAPEVYRPMMPPALPAPDALIAISGVAELLGGLGLLLAPTRRWAGWGLILLLLAVFPANCHMALAQVPFGGRTLPAWVLWARLPLQPVFIAWVWWVALAAGRPRPARLPPGADQASDRDGSSMDAGGSPPA